PYDRLLSKESARARRKLIDPQKASLELRPGEASTRAAQPQVNLNGNASHDGDTSYIAVVDQGRNMVSFEPSLHEIMGTGVVMGDTALIFNCRRGDYSFTPRDAN